MICDEGSGVHEASAWRYRSAGADGCRGDGCREAHRIYHAAERAGWAQRPDIPHGTETGYSNWGCRCEACRKSYRLHNARCRAVRKLVCGLPLSALTALEAAAYEAGPPPRAKMKGGT